jgi:PAS domain-containing protein
MAELTFAIGEVAAMLGISPHTIRAWERRHLVVRPTRTSAGQRRYSSDDVELLRQIKHERHVHGLSMRVATLTAQGLVVPDGGDPGAGAAPPPAIEAGADPLRLVADLVPEVVVVVDPRGRVTHANTAFARFCEVTVGQLRGSAFADFVDPFDRAKAVQAYQEPLRRRRDWELNLCQRSRRAFFSFDCWPISSAEGSMLVLVGRDLTVEPLPPEALDGVSAIPATAPEGGVAARLRALLDGAADPVRTLGLAREWLDATPLGVVLAGAGQDLPVVFANRAFRGWLPPERPPEGRPWHALRPEAEADVGRFAGAAAEAIRSGRPRVVRGRRPVRGGPVWDVEIAPVADADGRVAHLVLVVADATAEQAAGRLDALVACASALRHAAEPGQVLRSAARLARDLLPGAGSLVAAASGGDVSVVAASGVWSGAARDAEHDLRLALVRDAVRTCASIEVARSGAGEDVETLRVVPLRERGRALGALAFSRPGEDPFSTDDRQLIDEFAGRVALALGRVM